MVKNINELFRNFMTEVNCSGGIELSKPNLVEGSTDDKNADVDKYGITIKVSFRDNQQLENLSSQQQSGGEKSLTTIMFLLSLQDMNPCPFRLVDEINQGMDADFERMTYRRLFMSAKRQNLPQYFVITPKLLTDLEYEEDVTVHVIFCGSYLFSNSKVFNVEETLKQAKRNREGESTDDNSSSKKKPKH